jgi:hypothetical protein
MFFKLKRKTLALNFFLILLVLSMGYNHDMRNGANSAFATSPTIVSQIRGDTYSDAALSDGTHMWTGGLEPWMKASNGTYVPYILSQNSTHYIIDNKQAPFIINKNNCITSIYDNSVPLAQNPASIINKEWWDVSYHTSASPLFINMDLSSTACTISVTTNSSGIFIDTSKAFPAGTLEVTYEKIIGKPWETILTPTNTLPASYSIKPIERISGISADNIVVGKTAFTGNATLSSQIINQTSSVITIHKGSKSFMFDENNALTNFKQLNITKTSSGFSLSADYGNNIPVLSTNQKFTIDPTFGYSSGTLYPLSDASSSSTSCSTSGIFNNGHSYIIAEIPASSDGSTVCYLGDDRWNISSIPSNAITITSTTLKVNFTGGTNAINCDYVQMTHDPNTATVSQQWTDITTNTAYVSNDAQCTTVGNGKTITLGSTANTDVKNQLSAGWFATGFRLNPMVRDSLLHSSFIGSSTSNVQLQIVYTVPSPAAPTLQKSNTVNSTAITSTWTSSTGATWYQLNRTSPASGATFVQAANTSSTTFTNTGLTAGTQYLYKVFAGNSSGTSPASNTKSNYTTNVAPTALTFTGMTKTTARITWTNPSGNFTGFKIEKESPTGGGFSTVVANTGNNTNHYDLTSLALKTQYNIRISTVYGAIPSVSSPSTANSFFTLGNAPNAPTGLTTPTQSISAINLRWLSSTGATWYLVDRESPIGGGFSQIANVTTLTYSNMGLIGGTQYNYDIFAGNSTGTSLASAPSSNYTSQLFPSGNNFTGSNTFSRGIILNGNITAPNGICIGAC